MRLALALALTTVACAGCGDDGVTPDAPHADAAVDATVDAGSCTGPQAFTGELVDFDSTLTSFMGVFDAGFALRGEPGCTARTAPNGRFIMTLPASDAIVDIDAPATYVDGLVVVPQATITATGASYSLRSFTAARADALYQSLAQTFDVTRGHVLIFQAQQLDSFALTGTNGVTIDSADGSGWAPGNAARYVLFTNVEVGTGTQTLSSTSGAAVGVGPLPIEAGKLTFATTVFTP